MECVSDYINMLKHYYSMAHSLHTALDEYVELISVNYIGQYFRPTQKTVLAQLHHWPLDIATPIPPVAWVHPHKGTFQHEGDTWSFAFHGQGVSFIRDHDQLDVSVEYTALGSIGIVEDLVGEYLSSSHKTLWSNHYQLFNICVQQQQLIASPARYGSDSTTFIPNW